ncbi:MAG TPA: glycosyltransferase [Solirubrobacteraceae bacterium]|nr:glycosyltransferase [Solirubrobacteraceae bacterium]
MLGDLEPVTAALAERSVVLASRFVGDIPDDGLQPSREQSERAGRICGTFAAVDCSPRAGEFLGWWRRHVEAAFGSLDGSTSGARPEDRPWLARTLELAPARFGAAVLDDATFNLSYWNLHEHILESTFEGVCVDSRDQLRLLNLPGFRPDRPHELNRAASRVRLSRSPVLRDLCEQYALELRNAGWSLSKRCYEIGVHMADGLVYDEALDALRVRAEALGERFDDLFSATSKDARAFTDWLKGPAPAGARYGINRYVFYRVVRERPDVMRAYPELDGSDGAEYVAWCWAFGREEMAIPDRFMPPLAGKEKAATTVPATGERQPAGSEPAVSGPRAREMVETPPMPGPHNTENGSTPVVRVTGYLGHTLGLGAAARGYAQALRATGVPVSTVSVPLHHVKLPLELQAGYGHHSFEDGLHQHVGDDMSVRNGFEIVAVNADELPDFVERLGEDYFHGPRIGIWGWETDSIPRRWQSAFALVQEIWVYSRFMAENIGAAAPVPVVALPPPVEPPVSPAVPTRLDVADDGFLFLFVFDYMSTIQRKNPVGLIEAFKRAFSPGEGPRLLLKTINAPLRPLAEEEVLWAARGRADIHVIDRSLTEDELNGLVAMCDCYVSLHRSEGFGLTMAEAMAIGKPVIGTGYSGNLDFMTAQNSYLVEYELGRVGPDCEIYPPDGRWADPSIEHAAELMRRVIERPDEAAALGVRASADIARALSTKVTGAAMRERLEKLDALAARPTRSHALNSLDRAPR